MLTKELNVYVLEEQEIFKEAYRYIFPGGGPINLIDVSTMRAPHNIKEVALRFNPNIMLLSTIKLEAGIVQELWEVQPALQHVGIVLLIGSYTTEDVKLLRRMAARPKAGMAVFLKQSLVRAEQIQRIIMSVGEGQVIIDPALTSPMFSREEDQEIFKDLTPRELEILDLIAKGYTNSAIADALFIDVKTVHNHINNIYSKLRADGDFSQKHPRVSAARLYLRKTGELVAAAA